MGRLLYLVVVAIDIFVIWDIIRDDKNTNFSFVDTRKKVLWIIAVIFLPVLGPVLYYVIGKK